jgi:hypothetical protein
MRSSKSNIQEFNGEVESIVDALNARNAPIPELLNNLFTGYKACGDSTFVRYIGRKEEEYEDGTNNVTGNQLMQMALEKFKTLSDKGEWMKKTEEELEFIALRAQLEQMKKPAQTRPPRADRPDPKKKKGGDKFAWKLVPPKAGEPESKTVNGKKYIYCPHHHTTSWVLEVNQQGILHKTGCKAREQAAAASGSPGSGTTALTSVVEEQAPGAGFGGDEPNEENI